MSVGISDIRPYLPKQMIDIQKVIEKRQEQEDGIKVGKLLKRALSRTGLTSLHFPSNWQDPVTMAAEAAHQILSGKDVCLDKIRYLVSGTETGVDHSKPIAAYVLGALKQAGLALPESLSTFQTQHACAGGTLALLSVAALLSVNAESQESGLVICSDIARYEPKTSAEVTQGAGAVAMLVEPSPKLLELNLKTVGYCSRDVDDFFRPLGSDTAKVKGRYSINCYKEAVESALLNHAKRSGRNVKDILLDANMFALHVPYPNLPLETMQMLLEKYAGLSIDAANAFLEERGFFSMTEPVAKSGNIYSGSLFLSLAFLLKNRLEVLGDAIVGKKLLLGSYGSGNTMALIETTVCPGAIEVIKDWDLEAIFSKKETEFAAYEAWVNASKYSCPTPEGFYLHNIREDGYREYLHKN
jgi:hydroxymethylglutaryl-CoA synthase